MEKLVSVYHRKTSCTVKLGERWNVPISLCLQEKSKSQTMLEFGVSSSFPTTCQSDSTTKSHQSESALNKMHAETGIYISFCWNSEPK